MASWAKSADADKLAATTAAAKAEPLPAGIPPEQIERCMRARKAAKDASADQLTLAQLEAKKAQEKCVRTVIAQHRKKPAGKK